MCGIIGYLGKKEAQSILIKGLKRLEYRGYDSVGVAIFMERVIHLMGNLFRLEQDGATAVV